MSFLLSAVRSRTEAVAIALERPLFDLKPALITAGGMRVFILPYFSLFEPGEALSRERIGSLIHGVGRMPLDPMPFDAMRCHEHIKPCP